MYLVSKVTHKHAYKKKHNTVVSTCVHFNIFSVLWPTWYMFTYGQCHTYYQENIIHICNVNLVWLVFQALSQLEATTRRLDESLGGREELLRCVCGIPLLNWLVCCCCSRVIT